MVSTVCWYVRRLVVLLHCGFFLIHCHNEKNQKLCSPTSSQVKPNCLWVFANLTYIIKFYSPFIFIYVTLPHSLTLSFPVLKPALNKISFTAYSHMHAIFLYWLVGLLPTLLWYNRHVGLKPVLFFFYILLFFPCMACVKIVQWSYVYLTDLTYKNNVSAVGQ